MGEAQENENRGSEKISRRQFVIGLATMAGAGLLAACNPQGIAGEGSAYDTPTPGRVLPGVRGTPGQVATGEPEGSIPLEQFLALSSLLTGVDNLDPGLGEIYRQAVLAGAQPGSRLADVYSAASAGSNLPEDLDTLQQGGFFEQEGVGDLADTILKMWYTGTYQIDGEDHVATYVDALSWKVLHFTKAPTTCGHFGFWAQEPRVSLSPSVEYTPVPTPAEGG